MSVKGKTRANVVAVTCTDFGDPSRRAVIQEHYSFAAAARAYQNHWDRLHRLPAQRGQRPLVRIWIEYVQPEGGNMAQGTEQLKEKP